MKDVWIDLQVNGRHGIAFNSPRLTVEEVILLTEKMVAEGTVGFLAAMSTTAGEETTLHTAGVIREARRRSAACEKAILGLHLEGPFVSREKGYSRYQEFLITRIIRKLLLSGKSVSHLRASEEATRV